MVPTGAHSGSRSISPVLMRSNSGILGFQGGSMQLAQYMGGGSLSSDLSALECNLGSIVANDAGFNSSFDGSDMVICGKVQRNQIAASPSGSQQSHVQQFEPLKFQHGQHQLQSAGGGLGAVGPVKLEPQVINGQIGPRRKLQSPQSLGPMKVEPQQNQIAKGVGPVKLENQRSDQAVFIMQQQRQRQQLRQQEQQQQLLHMSRQSSQAAVSQMNYLQQQRFLHILQQQQHLRAIAHQQAQTQQFQQQLLPVRSVARPVYEPGTCARRLTQYMYQQQHRPQVKIVYSYR